MIKRIISKIPDMASASITRAREALPELPAMPNLSLMSEAEIPVYVVHQSGDKEDYVFFFDFEKFMRESQQGMFVRPVLKVWTGRSDFERINFARSMREAFTRQFAHMQDELLTRIEEEKNAKKSWGWFDLGLGVDIGLALGGAFLQTILLALAVTRGKAALTEILLHIPSLFRKSDTPEERLDKLHTEIEAKKKVIDVALTEIKITLHRDLYTHAYPEGPAGAMTWIDVDSWPLPEHVQKHMNSTESGAWW